MVAVASHTFRFISKNSKSKRTSAAIAPFVMSTQSPTRPSGAQRKNKHNPTSGLLEDVVETLSPPILEGSEGDVVPEDLAYIGSYNWVDSPNPTIVVPGQ